MDKRLVTCDHNYLNISVRNTKTNEDILAKYQETRSTVIIENPNEHYLAVVRFEIPLNLVPIFNLKYIANDPANPLIYSVTLKNGVNELQVFLLNNQSNGNVGIYTIQSFIDIVNIAINTGATALGMDIPLVSFDPKSQLCTIYFTNNANWLGDANTAVWQLWFNKPLFDKFAQFYVQIPFGYNGPNGKFAKYYVQDNFNGNYITVGANPGYYMTQEFPFVSQWDEVASIVIVSTKIPVNKEDISLRGDNGNNILISAISDFIPIRYGSLSRERYTIEYTPESFILLDMNSNMPLRTFDFQVYYVDLDGILYPLYLAPYSRMSLKLGFFKKSLFSNAWTN
jgi:hypothetical protein